MMSAGLNRTRPVVLALNSSNGPADRWPDLGVQCVFGADPTTTSSSR